MLELNQKTIAYGIIAISAVLLIILVFVKLDLDDQGAFLCEAVAADPSMTMEQCPAHQSSSSWLLLIVFGIAFLMLSAGIYLLFVPINRDVVPQKKVDLSKLDADEKKIYDLLKESEGSVYQSDLIKETDFSKVKMTRILDKLVNKGIVDRQRRGMTNIVVLK